MTGGRKSHDFTSAPGNRSGNYNDRVVKTHQYPICPVAGLTTAWHHSPDQSAIPLGSTVKFRVVLEPGIAVTWIGAAEVYRDEHESVASCEFNEIGQAAVQALADDDLQAGLVK